MPVAKGTYEFPVPILQADAVLSQVNPGSVVLYTVLPVTNNVRLITMNAKITWAANPPTLLEIIATVDGIPIIFGFANPVSNTDYYPQEYSNNAMASMLLSAADHWNSYNFPFLFEGRSIGVQVRITYPGPAVPTPLVCRVKWARWP